MKKPTISREDLAYVTLIKSGSFKASEAYRLLFDTKANDASILTLSSKKSTALADYLKPKDVDDDDLDLADLDKDSLIAEMTKIAARSNDPKVKLDALAKIAVIKDYKNELPPEKEDETIRYYLPISCHICQLFKDAKAAA